MNENDTFVKWVLQRKPGVKPVPVLYYPPDIPHRLTWDWNCPPPPPPPPRSTTVIVCLSASSYCIHTVGPCCNSGVGERTFASSHKYIGNICELPANHWAACVRPFRLGGWVIYDKLSDGRIVLYKTSSQLNYLILSQSRLKYRREILKTKLQNSLSSMNNKKSDLFPLVIALRRTTNGG